VTALHVDSVGRPELSAEVLGGVRCPVLLVAGADDESTRRAQGRRFAEVSAMARYIELEGAAHAVHHKCRDTFTQVISAFLAEVDSKRAGSHGATEDS
jgi:3-oxoadipate enol-lactonase